ncbi:MAG: BamA/TamA family outer membrane protein [Alistipes sp.]|nr:BamA/TamA family outer membrane protein [Alistipes sp.]
MRGRLIRYVMLVAMVMTIVSCSVTRDLPEGTYLLSSVRFEEDKSVPRDRRITVDKDGLDTYVRQSPNKKIFGLDFYVWVYEHANPEKHDWWNNFKRKIGEEPVLLDSALTVKSVQNLETYLQTRGYFSSDVECKVDTIAKRRRVKMTYKIEQGLPTRIDSLSYDFRDSSLRSVILADTASSLLNRGDILDISRLDDERNRIAAWLNNRGYFDFTANNISYDVDTTERGLDAAVTMIVRPTLVGYNERGGQIYENNAVYRLRNINIYPTYDPMLRSTSGFKADAVIDTTYYNGLTIIRDLNTTPQLRNAVLRRTVPLYPNYIYNASQISRTNKELMSMGFFSNSKVAFDRVNQGDSYLTFIGEEAEKNTLVDSRERYLDCNIYVTPALKQSMKVEVEASTTSTFYGLAATLGYSNTNAFRGAEAFDISARFGFEFMYARDVEKRSAQELGLTLGLSFPRFLSPFWNKPGMKISHPRTRLELAFDYQNRPYYCRNIFTTRWAYSWQQGARSSLVIRPVDINWIDVKSVDEAFLSDIDNQYLRTSFESQLTAGLSASWVYNTQRSNFDQNVTVVRANLETAGNLLQGLEKLFSHPAEGKDYYEIFGIRYSQYVRADLSASHKIDLGHKMALAGRLFGGVGVTYGNSMGRSIPFDRMFYCGGANSMRGWVPRTLGPGNKPEVHDNTYPAQVGDVRLEANLEFRFPIWWIFNAAVFVDAGNVWYLRDTEDNNPEEVFHFDNFYRQLGLNTGVGLRIDVTFIVLRLDLGIQLHNPGRPVGERWIHNFKWKNMALNFGVGYPF